MGALAYKSNGAGQNRSGFHADRLASQENRSGLVSTRDNRASVTEQGEIITLMNNSPQVRQLQALQCLMNKSSAVKKLSDTQDMMNGSGRTTAQQQSGNNSGVIGNARVGAESISGGRIAQGFARYGLGAVAQFRNHAFSQGAKIHLGPGQLSNGKFGFIDGLPAHVNQPKSIIKSKMLENLVIQRVKYPPDSDVELDSDFEESSLAETNALKHSYRNGIVPLKRSKQAERVLKLRKKLRLKSRKAERAGAKRVIRSKELQSILAELNSDYSPQNTTAIGIDGKRNMIVTKMAGANANYLGKILKATVIEERRKSPKGSNKYHAEKVLSDRRGGRKFRRLIIDKKRCTTCGQDKGITESANEIRD